MVRLTVGSSVCLFFSWNKLIYITLDEMEDYLLLLVELWLPLWLLEMWKLKKKNYTVSFEQLENLRKKQKLCIDEGNDVAIKDTEKEEDWGRKGPVTRVRKHKWNNQRITKMKQLKNTSVRFDNSCCPSLHEGMSTHVCVVKSKVKNKIARYQNTHSSPSHSHCWRKSIGQSFWSCWSYCLRKLGDWCSKLSLMCFGASLSILGQQLNQRHWRWRVLSSLSNLGANVIYRGMRKQKLSLFSSKTQSKNEIGQNFVPL